MITAGIDLGSLSVDAVILSSENGDKGKILSYSIIPTGVDNVKTANTAMEEALKGTDVTLHDIDFIIATGYGRVIVPFANKNITEITCHGKGAHWLTPSARTVLDMGGQDCKVTRINSNGKAVNFVMNDKCAAGAGRSMEVMAKLVREPLEEIGELSLKSYENPAAVSSTCVLFARSEVTGLLRKGYHKNDILAGACDALTSRILSLIGRVVLEEDLFISGGIAKNIGIVKRIEDKLGVKAIIPEEPQIVGALGAAIFAKETLLRTKKA